MDKLSQILALIGDLEAAEQSPEGQAIIADLKDVVQKAVAYYESQNVSTDGPVAPTATDSQVVTE